MRAACTSLTNAFRSPAESPEVSTCKGVGAKRADIFLSPAKSGTEVVVGVSWAIQVVIMSMSNEERKILRIDVKDSIAAAAHGHPSAPQSLRRDHGRRKITLKPL